MTLFAIFVGAAVLVIALFDHGRQQRLEEREYYRERRRRRKRNSCLPVAMFFFGVLATLGLMFALAV
jgi:hypothetical protein